MRDQPGQGERIEITLRAHGGIGARCSGCQLPSPGYDRLAERRWEFVPLWGIATSFLYTPRRVQCPEHGVVVEHIPWSSGKRPVTTAMMGFLARWARRLSWRETATAFQTSWESVYRSVEWFVEYGLAHRELSDVESRSEEHTSELQSLRHLVCRLLLEKTNMIILFGALNTALFLWGAGGSSAHTT